jgi:LPPG:FO 2-phospho-L-lactate transferase
VPVALLAGGVGGARMALALQEALPPGDLVVIGNVGDDVEHWGLAVSPDLDTVLYTLTGRIDPEHGWGVAGDTRHAMEAIVELGEDGWFILGDRDLGLHVARTRRLRAGEPLSSVTADVAARWGCATRVLPATDDPLRTWIATDEGELPFQEWLVRRRAADAVAGVRFDGTPAAEPAPGVLEAIAAADRVVLAPSNPFVSLDPILAVRGVREAVAERRADAVAVSPVIAGRAVKGPLVGMLASLGHRPDAVGVAAYLAPLVGRFVLDAEDAGLAAEVEALDVAATCVPTLMADPGVRAGLAAAVLA